MISQGDSACLIKFDKSPGDDVKSMSNCLQEMGVKVETNNDGWLVEPPKQGLSAPNVELNCGNSGTSARVISALIATMGREVKLDGDESLRARSSELGKILRDLDVDVDNDSLPVIINGKMKGKARVNLSQSSQPLSALVLASPSLEEPIEIHVEGEAVSRGYLGMTFDIARNCGYSIEMNSQMTLKPWKVSPPSEIDIPPELSLFPMAILLELLHDGLYLQTELATYDPLLLMAFDAIDTVNGGEVDLRDASDLITPAAVWMALGEGGRISGIPHARGKESDRILRTVELLKAFGMNAEETKDGLEIPGNQTPKPPNEPVQTHMDHRLAMVAMILASKVGGEIIDAEICEVSHPGFIQQLFALCQP
jgi:3-phosphoshikimate 1-carboxyvinyltransferase